MNTEETEQEKELSTSTKLNEMLLMVFVANVMQQSAKGKGVTLGIPLGGLNSRHIYLFI